MNKNFQEYFLDDPIFKLEAIQKSIGKIFKKTTSKKSIFVGSSESIKRILEKYLQRNLYFRKLFYIYEQNLWNTPEKDFFFFFFFQFTILLQGCN